MISPRGKKGNVPMEWEGLGREFRGGRVDILEKL
jgi:hypothetical protein